MQVKSLFEPKNQARVGLMFGQVFNAGIGFLTISWLAKNLPQESFGTWVLFLTNWGVLEMIRAGLVYQALVKFIASSTDSRDKNGYVTAAWIFSFVLTIFLFLLLHLLALLYARFYPSGLLTFFFDHINGLIWWMLPINMATWLGHANEKYMRFWFLGFLSSALFLGALLFFESTKLEEIYLYFLYSKIAVAVVSIIIYPPKIKRFRLVFYVRNIYLYSKFTVVYTRAANLLKSVDFWLIGFFLGPQMVAIYNVPLRLLEVVEIPLRSFVMSAFPTFSQLAAQKKYDQFLRKLQKEVLLFSCCILLFVALASWKAADIITLFANEGFAASVPVLRAALLYVLFLPLDRYIGVALDSLHLPQINTYKVLGMAFFNLIGSTLVLFLDWPLYAVALVTLGNIGLGITFGFRYLITYIQIQKTEISAVSLN
mgnify:FL=1